MASRKAMNQFLILPILLITCFGLLLGQCARLQRTQEGGDLVTATCKHTLHFKVCVSSLRSVPSSKRSDLKMLAGIALNLSSNHAAKTLSYVYDLESSASNSTANNKSHMSLCLSDCIEEYSEARENLKDAAEALAEGDYEQVDTLVSAAMSDAETCEDGFKEMFIDDGNKDYSTPSLTKRNSYFSKLCSNALAITKLLLV